MSEEKPLKGTGELLGILMEAFSKAMQSFLGTRSKADIDTIVSDLAKDDNLGFLNAVSMIQTMLMINSLSQGFAAIERKFDVITEKLDQLLKR
jgi:hypothetical protein